MAKIGIDFGSSYTTVAWINPLNEKPETVKFNGDGSVKLPSVLLATETGFVIGFQASSYLDEVFQLPFEQRIEIMSNFVPCIKKKLSTKATELLYGNKYSHEQLLTIFFKYVIEQTAAHCGSHTYIDSVVFSHPVEFEKSKIQLIHNAFTNLHIAVENTLYEPEAAVIGYSIDHRISDEEGILVFDFGGGTIDVACVQKKYGELKLATKPKGNSNCGGQDIDYLLYEDLRKKIQAKYSFDISDKNMIDYAMLNSCRRLKEYFSGPNDVYETNIALVIDGRITTYKYRLSRDTFNNIIYSKVSDAISVAKQVLADVNSKKIKVGKVLLIGGSSQLTLVREMLTELLPESEIDTCGEKDIAVALGNIYTPEKDKKGPENPPFAEPLNMNKSMICKKCRSEKCYKLVERSGYHCLDCGWEGKNITVTFQN